MKTGKLILTAAVIVLAGMLMIVLEVPAH